MEYNLKESFDDKYFELGDSYEQETKQEKKKDTKEENSEENTQEQENNTNTSDDRTTDNTSSSSTIDEVVYPMYVPVNTYLSNQDKVSTENGERVILTFSGETPFLLVQETASINDTTDFVYGDPYLILDTVGAVTDYSVSWVSNGVEYNVVSDTMNVDELITVAESISTVSVGK